MDITQLYSAIAVTDLEKSEDFYTSLLGRGPDDRPMDGLIQWQGPGAAGLQLVADPGKAGSSMMTIVTPSVELARSQLDAAGLDLEADIEGDVSVIAQISDLDGNRLTLAEPPSEPGAS